ncbi:MAG: TolC family protein [Phycisphaerales bacterium]|nr:TolC family protein [Phycisphaerales bacterium]
MKWPNRWYRTLVAVGGALTVLQVGCTVIPNGQRAQLRAVKRQGKVYRVPPLQRRPLSFAPTLHELVAWGVKNNPDVERAYWQWVQAVQLVPQAGTQATAPMLNAGAAINSGSVSAAGTTLGLSNMSSADIEWPGKLDAQARAALARARAAEDTFLNKRFTLRRDILIAYDRWAWREQSNRLLLQSHLLIKTMQAFAKSGVQTGRMNAEELLKLQDQLAQHRILMAQLAYACREDRYRLNAVIGRDPRAAIARPKAIPTFALVPLHIAKLAAAAEKSNASLHGLARQMAAARQDLRRAKMHYLPNFDVGAATSLDGLMQNVSGALVLPWIKYQSFNAAIAQMRAEIAESAAALRSGKLSVAARLAVDVQTLRSDAAQLLVLKRRVQPRLKEMLSLVQARYQTGSGSIEDQLGIQMSILDSQQAVLDLQRQIADRIADLDALVNGKVER